jgi:hypothetical protein
MTSADNPFALPKRGGRFPYSTDGAADPNSQVLFIAGCRSGFRPRSEMVTVPKLFVEVKNFLIWWTKNKVNILKLLSSFC